MHALGATLNATSHPLKGAQKYKYFTFSQSFFHQIRRRGSRGRGQRHPSNAFVNGHARRRPACAASNHLRRRMQKQGAHPQRQLRTDVLPARTRDVHQRTRPFHRRPHAACTLCPASGHSIRRLATAWPRPPRPCVHRGPRWPCAVYLVSAPCWRKPTHPKHIRVARRPTCDDVDTT
jgi:hypothetical protein